MKATSNNYILTYLQDGTFTLAYIDLHWATSEHNVIGQDPADLEMQLHHFDLSFDSYENAVKVPGATISLSLLFKVNHSAGAVQSCKNWVGKTSNFDNICTKYIKVASIFQF